MCYAISEGREEAAQSGRQFVKCVVPGFFILVFIIDVSKRERERDQTNKIKIQPSNGLNIQGLLL